jgi:hypothetical protein
MFRLASEYLIILQADELLPSKHQRHFNLILRDENRLKWVENLLSRSVSIFFGRERELKSKKLDKKQN